MAKQKKVVPVVAVQKPAYQIRTTISSEARKSMYQTGLAYWQEEAERYGWDDQPMPENVVSRLQAIQGALDQEQAQEALQRAKNTMQIMILSAWAAGKIEGPTSVLSLEKRIKKAENLADMLETKGQAVAAGTQRLRAQNLRVQLEALQAGLDSPTG